MKPTQSEKKQMHDNARDFLLRTLKPGDTVYTVLKHCSRSGMMRHISAYIVVNGQIVDISWYVAHTLDWRRAPDGGVKVVGAGMDMGYHLVYSLSYVLFRNESTSDAGYTLNHQWL